MTGKLLSTLWSLYQSSVIHETLIFLQSSRGQIAGCKFSNSETGLLIPATNIISVPRENKAGIILLLSHLFKA